MNRSLAVICILLALIVIFLVWQREPSLHRTWNVDQAIPTEIEISDETVRLKNVRNFTYRSVTDYTPGYYDVDLQLADLERVDFIVEPFGDIGAAHTFLSFGFKDGRQIAISAEIRKEVGETFSPWKGLFREYELMYVIADERDVIDLRVNHRRHDVYLYPTTATPEQARALFLSMLTRASRLMREPEFYHTAVNNCTTNIVRHINDLREGTTGTVPYDWRMIFPARSDELAKELGFIAQGLTIDLARQRYRINEEAAKFQGEPDFSVRLREFADESSGETNERVSVVSVIDGDTIEVLLGGRRERVRYIGIDTPEWRGTAQADECLAAEAYQVNVELVEGEEVTLVRDVSERDEYGRLLRYVLVETKDVGAELLRTGLARAVRIEPDSARYNEYVDLERDAREAALGQWGGVCRE